MAASALSTLSGLPVTAARNSSRSRIRACRRLMAVTVAVLGMRRNRAISPNESPAPISLNCLPPLLARARPAAIR